MRHVLAVVSDIHAGSTVGLCCPEPVELDDGGTYLPSRAQQWLHNRWVTFWQRVAAAKKGADSLTILCNGDLVDGDHHGTFQIISRDPAVQMWIAKQLFAPVLALDPTQVVVVRGTEAHVGKNAGAEEHFARWLHKEGVKVPKDPATKMLSWWAFRGKIGALVVSAAHHGRMGQRPWTKGGISHNLAAQIVMEHANRGDPIPDLAVRSHMHQYFDTGQAVRTRLIQTPAWQLHTSFAHKVVPESLADIGGVIITVEDGRPTVDPVLFVPERPALTRLA